MIESTSLLKTENRETFLDKLLTEARQEDQDVRDVLRLMGWSELPAEMVMEIKDDILAFRKELEGSYSSCDPFVEKRRKRVAYWVDMLLKGACSLDTARDAVKIRPL